VTRVLTRTEFAMIRHGVFNSKIAALPRSTVTHDHHPPKPTEHA
jgi:hypothetical protein